MGAVPVRSARRFGMVVRVEPVELVIEAAAAEVATVLVDQRLVRVEHARVNVAEHHAGALVPQRPHLRRFDVLDADDDPLWRWNRAAGKLFQRRLNDALGADRSDFGRAFQRAEQCGTQARDGNAVVHPKYPVLVHRLTQSKLGRQRLAYRPLFTCGEITQCLVHIRGARIAVTNRECGRKIRLAPELDQDRRILASGESVAHDLFDSRAGLNGVLRSVCRRGQSGADAGDGGCHRQRSRQTERVQPTAPRPGFK